MMSNKTSSQAKPKSARPSKSPSPNKNATVYVERDEFLADPDKYLKFATSNRLVKVKSSVEGKFLLVVGGKLW
jgi:hypothetical protein